MMIFQILEVTCKFLSSDVDVIYVKNPIAMERKMGGGGEKKREEKTIIHTSLITSTPAGHLEACIVDEWMGDSYYAPCPVISSFPLATIQRIISL